MSRHQPGAAPRTAEGNLAREQAWLAREVAAARDLTDADRSFILEDLFRTLEAIRAGQTPEGLRREDEVRRFLDEPGRRNYRALAERLA
ncbi:MAG: hypothetical protein MUE73_18045 [Planctomycetes bacterium]|jgi:hypothetical protein|nr:hypothetical protein [Planctomycetota bacterium]